MKITETILAGNCDDATEEQIERYADLVRAEFAKQFPNAEIDVIVRPESGTGPKTSIEFDDGEDHDSHAEFVAQRIAQNVWDSGEYWT